jgi:MFS family permease
MIASFSFYLLSFGLFYLSPCFSIFALAMVIFALGEALRSGTHKAMILEYLRIKGIEDHKVEYYGHTRAASQLGAALTAIVAAGLVFYAGSYRILFLFSIVPCILGLLLMISYPRKLDGSLIRLEGNGKIRVIAGISVTLRDFSSTLRRSSLLRGLASSAFFDAAFKSTEGYLQPILQIQALALPILLFVGNHQRVAIVVGIMYFAIHLATSYASQNAGRLTAYTHSLPVAANITCLLGVTLLAAAGLAAALGAYGLSIAAFLGFHLLQNIRRPIMVGYLAGIIPHHTMATGLSVETQLRTLLVAGLAPLAGLLADSIGIGEALVVIAVAAALGSIALRLRDNKAR